MKIQKNESIINHQLQTRDNRGKDREGKIHQDLRHSSPASIFKTKIKGKHNPPNVQSDNKHRNSGKDLFINLCVDLLTETADSAANGSSSGCAGINVRHNSSKSKSKKLTSHSKHRQQQPFGRPCTSRCQCKCASCCPGPSLRRPSNGGQSHTFPQNRHVYLARCEISIFLATLRKLAPYRVPYFPVTPIFLVWRAIF